MTNLDQAPREVYARYGFAMYCAQLLEHELVTFVVVTHSMRGAFESRQQSESFEAELTGSTMGRQLQHALADARISETQAESLRRALKTRNFLAHDYFRERAELMLSVRGTQEMEAELERLADEIIEADRELTSITRALMEDLGLTAEMIEVEVERTRRSLAAD